MSSHNNYKKIFDEVISDLRESIPDQYKELKELLDESSPPVSGKADTKSDLFQKLVTQISKVREAIISGEINSYAKLSTELDGLKDIIKEVARNMQPNKFGLFSNNEIAGAMSDALLNIESVSAQLKSELMKRYDVTYHEGDKVWAQHRSNGTWCRASVLGIKDDNIEVKYYDFVDSDTVSPKELCSDYRNLIKYGGDHQIKSFDQMPTENNLKRAADNGGLNPDDDGMVKINQSQATHKFNNPHR